MTAYDELISETARAADDRAPEILAPADVVDEPLLATASAPKPEYAPVDAVACSLENPEACEACQ